MHLQRAPGWCAMAIKKAELAHARVRRKRNYVHPYRLQFRHPDHAEKRVSCEAECTRDDHAIDAQQIVENFCRRVAPVGHSGTDRDGRLHLDALAKNAGQHDGKIVLIYRFTSGARPVISMSQEL